MDEDATDEMLDRITGDNPPPLDKCRANEQSIALALQESGLEDDSLDTTETAIRIIRRVVELEAEIARLRAELKEARALSAKLRDQFAMAIAGGELASQSRDWGGYLPGNEGHFAERVWKLTDAVLAARAGEEG